MNFVYDYSNNTCNNLSNSNSTINLNPNFPITNIRMIETYDNETFIRGAKSPFEVTNSQNVHVDNIISNQFDFSMHDVDGVNVDSIASENKNEDDILHSNSSSSSSSSSGSAPRYATMMNCDSLHLNVHRHHIHQQPSVAQLTQLQQTSNQYGFSNLNQANSNAYLANKKNYNKANGNVGSQSNQNSAGLYTMSNNTTNNCADKNNIKYSNEYNSLNKFQYVLMAPTSPAVKSNEDTLTYLNQGQNYELRLSVTESMHINLANSANNDGNGLGIQQLKQEQGYHYLNSENQNNLEDIKPMIINGKANVVKSSNSDANNNNNSSNLDNTSHQIVEQSNNQSSKLSILDLNDSKKNLNTQNVYLSVIRLCFWDRKLQEIEHEEIKEWEKEYAGSRMLEIDNNSSYGTIEIRTSNLFTNMAEVIWNGNTGANIFFRCNCTSTAFAPHKHGGEKGIHMRFQIDTFELNPNVAGSFQNSLTINCNEYQTSSMLSPPNSSSSPVSNKFSKDDLDSSSNFQQQSQRRLPTPSPLTEPSNWKHACSSYSRIQLFRLKGAQRKLKTDRSKIERLNPSDLRKRYQPSNKITLLYNCPFDPLYSMMPLPRDGDNTARHYRNHHQSQLESSSNTLDSCAQGLVSMDYLRNSISNDMCPTNVSNLYHMNSSNSIASTASSIYNGPNYGLQTIPSESVHHTQLTACNSDLMQNMNSMGYQSQAQTPSQPLINNYESTFGTSSLGNDEYHQFYLDANQNSYNTQLLASNNGLNMGGYNDEQIYQRIKRKSSTTSSCASVSTPVTPYPPGINQNLNNGSYLYRAKFQKTSNLPNQSFSAPQLYSNPTITNQNGGYITSSSSSSTSSLSSPNSPMSPNVATIIKADMGLSGQTIAKVDNHSHYNMPVDTSQYNSTSNTTGNSLYNTSVANQAPASQVQSKSSLLNNLLPHDCNNKYVQEWFIANRFCHLLHLFNNYTSNDILRLSKEDLISLCGAPDGIRCFNLAHNIQIKPKLTIFITFHCQNHYSAVFLTDWKSKFLINKIFSYYSTFIQTINGQDSNEIKALVIKDAQIINNNEKAKHKADDCSQNDEDKTNKIEEKNNEDNNPKIEENLIDNLNKTDSTKDTDENKTLINQTHLATYETIQNSPHFEYELFIKLKGILVKTNDEVLNNLVDQSRFLIEFELPRPKAQSLTPNTPSNSTSIDQTLAKNIALSPKMICNKNKNVTEKNNNLVKIVMIPLD